MVGIVDARQPVIIIVVGDGLAFLGKVGCLLGMVHLSATELALSDTIIPISVTHNLVHSSMIIPFY